MQNEFLFSSKAKNACIKYQYLSISMLQKNNQ
jgi:hypothetical protein